MSAYLNGTRVAYTLGAYNRVMSIADPSLPSNAPLKHLIGFLARVPCNDDRVPCAEVGSPGAGAGGGYYAGGVFFIRSSSSTPSGPPGVHYALNEIGGERRSSASTLPPLVAPRTYVASPFAGDSAVYFGGYDCNNVLAPTNTAWVFRGDVSAVLTPLAI